MICGENHTLGEKNLQSFYYRWNLHVPEKYVLKDMSLHLYELIECKGTLHQLTDILDNWVLDLVILCTNEKADSGNENANLLANDTFAGSKRVSEVLNGVSGAVLARFPYQSPIEESYCVVNSS